MPRMISLDPNQRQAYAGTGRVPVYSHEREAAPGNGLIEPAEVHVLHLVSCHGQPITKGQLSRLSGLSPAEVCDATDVLCRQGLLKRLNTLVESFVAAATIQG